MFELAVLLTRYLILLYIVLFFFVNEKQQKLIVLLMHITCFAILIYNSGDSKVALIGVSGFAFIIVANIALNLVYKNGKQNLWNIMFFLMDIGLIMITRLDIELAQRQLLWFFVGIFSALLIPLALIIVKKIDKFKYLYLFLSAALLLSPFFIGSKIYGSVNWISIAGFTFQPSEIVKFLFVFYLAASFRNEVDLKKMLLSAGVSASLVLILVLQRDLGGAFIFFTTYMIVIFTATGSIAFFSLGIAGFASAAVIAFHLFSHVRVRVNAWLNTWQYIDTDGYQIALGLFSIGTYGLFGSGLTLGYPNFNSVVERDMIFAAISEEFGSLFGILLILLYVLMFYRGMEISSNAKSKFHSLLALGFTVLLSFQTFLILGGIVRLIPLTGVTLPFISYGGSSLVVVILMIGLLQWIHSNNIDSDDEGFHEMGDL